jgi:multiple antibiotic resistance protein
MAEALTIFLRIAALTIATLAPLINPAGTAPIFLSLTIGASERLRAVLARRVARNVFIVLVGALLGGSSVLVLFGLTLAEIRISGGLLVIATAWHLMHAEERPDAEIVARSQIEANEPAEHVGFYPLTFPVTIGPGSLTIAVTLGAGGARDAPMASLLGAIAGIAVVSVIVYFCYRFAARGAKVLGSAGTLVLVRLSAFILLSVGVKILCDGLIDRFTTGSA